MVEDVSKKTLTLGGPSGSGSSVVLEADTENRGGRRRRNGSHYCFIKCLVDCPDGGRAALPIANCPLTPDEVVQLGQTAESLNCGLSGCYCSQIIDQSPVSSTKKSVWHQRMMLENIKICHDFGVILGRRGGPIEV